MSDFDDNSNSNEDEKKYPTLDDVTDDDPLPEGLEEGEDGEIYFDDPGKKNKSNKKEAEPEPQTEKDDYSPFGTNCIYYPTNRNRWIGGTQENTLAEIEKKVNRQDGGPIYVMTKSFTSCKPVEIIKDKNPLAFLDLPQQYTIRFKGSERSGNFIVKHSTIADIAGVLRASHALSTDGIDVALQTQVKAFEAKGILKETEDMSYTGFFTNEDRTLIIPSGITFKETDNSKLIEALAFIEDLARLGYHGRLDLLAHVIKFAIIAPFSFIFKYIKSAWLEWLHLYGKPNAGKTSCGKIVLAFDGHEKIEEFSVNMGHVDTIARLGETLGKTTFPILVDEMDYNDDRRLVNNVKMAIANTILRIVLDRYRRKETIPALCSLVFTSNPEPPNESGFRKRLAIRYFADDEIHFKDAEDAKKFDALLLDLEKLQTFGDFRNSYVMENQDIILDKRLSPFEKSIKIIIAAYEQAGLIAPAWLIKGQLEQEQLQESLIDSKEMVLNAFKNLIIDRFRTFLKTEDLQNYQDYFSRLIQLVNYDVLPFTRRIKTLGREDSNYIAINTGIIKELHEYNVTKDQLPNLKALADYMGGTWRRQHGRTFVEIDHKRLKAYLEE